MQCVKTDRVLPTCHSKVMPHGKMRAIGSTTPTNDIHALKSLHKILESALMKIKGQLIRTLSLTLDSIMHIQEKISLSFEEHGDVGIGVEERNHAMCDMKMMTHVTQIRLFHGMKKCLVDARCEDR